MGTPEGRLIGQSASQQMKSPGSGPKGSASYR